MKTCVLLEANTREQKILEGYLPRVIHHEVFNVYGEKRHEGVVYKEKRHEVVS